MKNLKFLFISTLLLVSNAMFAQQTATGNVTEEATGMSIPGVNVLIKGTTKGGVTDFDGNFTIENVENGAVLEFSFMGYKTTEVVFDGSQMSVVLQEDAAMLDEVMVIGYGTARKKDVTGSVALVNEKNFNEGPTANASQLIQGKIPGVAISSGNGAPGAGQSIRIRGTGSLSLNADPLIVVDGVPLDGSGVGGSRNILNSFNPNDIASMSVLKDASATAIYGSRAANGVILITTKKGKVDQDLKVSFSSVAGVSQVNNYVDVLNAQEMAFHVTERDPAAAALLGGQDTNWQKEIYQDAINFESNLSASGAIGAIPYRISAGYTTTEGVLKTDQFDRTTARIALTPYAFDDKLKMEFNANASFVDNTFADNGAIGSAVGYDPTQPVYDENSKFGGYSFWEDPATGNRYNLAPNNPLAMLNLREDTSSIQRFTGNAKFDYTISEGLTATVNAGYDSNAGEGTVVVDPLMPTASPDFDGSFTEYSQTRTNMLLDAYANYTHTSEELHSFNATLGYSYQQFDFESESTTNNYFKTAEDQVLFDDWAERSVLMSFFGRVEYNFDEKYVVTATLRADASSLLNPDDRWGYFPSAALKWNVSNEDFLIDSKVINNLGLRVGYGQVGNVNGLGPYQFLTNYNRSINGALYQFGNSGQFIETFRPQPINENLKWEIGTTFNVGVDYSLFDSRIFGTIDLYSKVTEDLIATTTVDPFTNFGNQINANIGDMRNNGLELGFNFVPVRSEKVEWTVNTNFTWNTNEVTNMPDVQYVGGISGATGNTVQIHQEGYAPYSFYVYEQVYDENQKPIQGVFVDRNNDGVISDDDRYIYEDPYADLLIGLSTQLNIGNFDLAANARLSYGNYVYDNTASSIGYGRRLTDNNILANVHRDWLNSGFEAIEVTSLQSDYYVRRADFFRLDNVTVGYTFNFNKAGSNLRVYASGNNLILSSDYSGLDPEIFGGIDNNFYPRPQIYSLGLNFNI